MTYRYRIIKEELVQVHESERAIYGSCDPFWKTVESKLVTEDKYTTAKQ
jgi:hypothetical protein